ncbi:hypothetical protein SAEN8230_21085 [Salmonella enterica subsp. arizonae]
MCNISSNILYCGGYFMITISQTLIWFQSIIPYTVFIRPDFSHQSIIYI